MLYWVSKVQILKIFMINNGMCKVKITDYLTAQSTIGFKLGALMPLSTRPRRIVIKKKVKKGR